MNTLVWYVGMERPDLQFWLRDTDGDLIDFSSGYTFTFKVGIPGSTAVFTKTSGITGAAGAGSEPTGTPNITLTFTAGDWDSVTPGEYTWDLIARLTAGNLDRRFGGRFSLRRVIT